MGNPYRSLKIMKERMLIKPLLTIKTFLAPIMVSLSHNSYGSVPLVILQESDVCKFPVEEVLVAAEEMVTLAINDGQRPSFVIGKTFRMAIAIRDGSISYRFRALIKPDHLDETIQVSRYSSETFEVILLKSKQQ